MSPLLPAPPPATPTLAVGAAALIALALCGSLAWLLGPAAASIVYVVGSGFEMALAHAARKRREVES